tara:strand:+ start:7115 stop:8113 length:999 start_codon:yes stop_codon:yes gene_type:complete
MKKLLSIIVLGLLLSGCASENVPDGYKLKTYTHERVNIIQKGYPKSNYNQVKNDFKKLSVVERETGKIVLMGFNIEGYEKLQKDINYKYQSSLKFETTKQIIYFKTYGSTPKKAKASLILSCEKYKKDKNIDIDCGSSNVSNRITPIGKMLTKHEQSYIAAKKNIIAQKEFEINQAKINKEIQEKDRAQKLADNKNRCEEIGFTPQTDSFAKCVLKLIELAEIRQSALIESRSRASLEAQMQQQQIDIQDQIASEAKASRDQQAWGVLLGMTMGSGILDSSSGGLFSSSTVSCNKTGESTSGTNKICYYNCMGSTKTINVGSMQFCPININK